MQPACQSFLHILLGISCMQSLIARFALSIPFSMRHVNLGVVEDFLTHADI